MNIKQPLTELVENTALLEPVNYNKSNGLKASLLIIPEYFNPAGSVNFSTALFV